MKEETCIDCRCANVCIFRNDVYKAISPFDDNTRKPYIKAVIVECSFKQSDLK